MSSIKFKSGKDEDGLSNDPFANLEKSSVLQEARSFNDTPIRPAKCILTLTKILKIINQGEHVSPNEATDAFFAMTKLFQSNDMTLRRMVYLTIKEMAKMAQDVIIVTSSLTKDMTGREEAFKGPAIRALCTITDPTMIQAIERYLKQALVSKNPHVASAGLVSALKIFNQCPDVVKRWVNEAQEALNSDNIMIQFHALGLLYILKKKDQLAVTKLVTKLSKSGLRSQYACCFLIRIAHRLVEQSGEGTSSPFFSFIEGCLRHRHEMVIFEAAHSMVCMKTITAKDLAPAVSVLQLFCSSPKPTLKFAAVRTLKEISNHHPTAVTSCNLDLENLINDGNRSIATLAITTLLKTCSESSVDRLVKQSATFMSEIPDEYKTVVVADIKAVCLKYPRKHSVLLSHLASLLRDEGGYEYKKTIVNAIINIVEEIPEAKEAGLAHLCEFIEDCEHTPLATRTLHLLGREGPKTSAPSKYIRFIYNRVILENAQVRVAAVSALARFGASCEELLPSILVLLKRCLMDSDDEVRDRATLYVSILEQNSRALNSAYILNVLSVSVAGLETALFNYCKDECLEPFDLKTVPLASQPIMEQSVEPVHSVVAQPEPTKPEPVRSTMNQEDVYSEQLQSIPEFARLGPLFKSSAVVELTEAETEYVVQCVKHTFPHHLVLQFNCTNTLQDQLLDNATVHVEPSVDEFEVLREFPCPRLSYDRPGSTYVLIKLPDEASVSVSCSFNCTLKFIVKDCDPNTLEPDDDEGYNDEYLLEDVEITLADHVQRSLKQNFGSAWDELGADNEVLETFQLSNVNSLQEAVQNIIKFMGLHPCERSDKVGDGKTSHSLYLSGVFRGGFEVLVIVKLALLNGVMMEVTVRSTDIATSEIVAASVA